MASKIKSWKDKPRNYEAKMMIESGYGRTKTFRDRRDRRSKEKASQFNLQEYEN